MKKLVIIGAGGFGREVYCSATESNGYGSEFEIVGFLDDNIHALDDFKGYPPVLGTISDYVPTLNDVFVCAIGNVHVRKTISQEIINKGGHFISLIHKSAYISKNVELGVGCLIFAGVRIHCDVKLGDYVMIQPSAIIGHDTIIGDWSLINTMSICGGASKIGECVTIHINSFVMPGAVIENDVTVGAGSVTMRRVKAGRTVFGVPAKYIVIPQTSND